MSAALAQSAPPPDQAGELHMLRLPLDVRRLMQFGRGHRLFGMNTPQDDGYLVHALFAALFGPRAPKPFALPAHAAWPRGEAGIMPVLAYAPVDLGRLSVEASAFADPDVYAAVRWDAAASKPMPEFTPGGRWGFELRACPVQRLARGSPDRPERERAARHRAGAEVDAFQAQWLATEPPDPRGTRSEVYAAWLDAQVAANGGAGIVTARMLAFRRTVLARRGREESGKTRPVQAIERPDARFGGVLEVTEAAAFRRLLARGIGRHRAFGFGMLLLRRDDSARD